MPVQEGLQQQGEMVLDADVKAQYQQELQQQLKQQHQQLEQQQQQLQQLQQQQQQLQQQQLQQQGESLLIPPLTWATACAVWLPACLTHPGQQDSIAVTNPISTPALQVLRREPALRLHWSAQTPGHRPAAAS